MTSKTEIELNLLRHARRDITVFAHRHICISLFSMRSPSNAEVIDALAEEVMEFLDGDRSVRSWLGKACSRGLIRFFQLAIIDTLMSRRQQ